MNLDEVMEGWRSQDASTFFGVDKTRLHQALQQEQAEFEKQSRRDTWGGYVFGITPLLIATGWNLATMIIRKDEGFPIVWDYVIGLVGVAAAITAAGALFAARRSQRARAQGFGDSLRDHLRRRIAQIDDEATIERRLGLIIGAAAVICVFAIGIGMKRLDEVPVPYGELDLPSPTSIVLIVGLLCLELFKWAPRRWRLKSLPRKRQLEALLKELDGQ